MCDLMLKSLKSAYNFCTKIYDSIDNYVHHSKDQPFNDVGYGYKFVYIYINNLIFLTIIIYGKLFRRITVMIDPTIKPEFCNKSM